MKMYFAGDPEIYAIANIFNVNVRVVVVSDDDTDIMLSDQYYSPANNDATETIVIKNIRGNQYTLLHKV